MPPIDPKESRRLGRFLAMGQVGMEMAVPIGIGIALDHYFSIAPACVIGGVLLGFVGGLFHLLKLAKQLDDSPPDFPRQEPP